MLKIMAIIWESLRLTKLVKSRTTKDSLAANGVLLVVLCIVAAVVLQFADLNTEQVITGITVALTFLTPLAARIANRFHKEFDVDPAEILIRARRGNTVAWDAFSGCVRDAAYENYTHGVTVDGMVVAIQKDGTGRKLGRKIRLPQPKKDTDK